MKTMIISAFPLQTEFIKEALFELEQYNLEDIRWYEGKFYTKGLLLVSFQQNKDLQSFPQEFLTQNLIKRIILLGFAIPLSEELRMGDIIIEDYPQGSCEKTIDLFLNQPLEEESSSLRIFGGKIEETRLIEQKEGLSCLDQEQNLLGSIKELGLPILNIRIISPNGDVNGLAEEQSLNLAQKLLIILKKAIEAND